MMKTMTREEKENRIRRLTARLKRWKIFIDNYEGDTYKLVMMIIRHSVLKSDLFALISQPTDDMRINTIDSGGITIR